MKKVLRTFKVEQSVWDTFTEICKANDRSASQVVRSLVKDFIHKNAQSKLC